MQAEQLRALPMPTLLIWGQSEKLLPYEGLDFFRAHLPAHAEIHEVKGFGHMPQMEHPAGLRGARSEIRREPRPGAGCLTLPAV